MGSERGPQRAVRGVGIVSMLIMTLTSGMWFSKPPPIRKTGGGVRGSEWAVGEGHKERVKGLEAESMMMIMTSGM